MKKIIVISLFFFSSIIFAQSEKLAQSYYLKGEYDKAIMLYRPLYETNPIRRDYFKNLLSSYQQTEKFDLADSLIQSQFQKFPKQTYLNIEIGYNYELQKQFDKAKVYYDKAIDEVRKNPNAGFMIGETFRQNHLLDEALLSYQIAKANNPKLTTEFNEAQVYGEKGDLDLMFDAYLNLIEKNEKYYETIQRYIALFVTDDPTNTTNIIFKKQVLKRAQNNPNDAWNILLSWLYMQQNEYDKALIQEKSLYKRNPTSLERIQEVGTISYENNAYSTAENSFAFIAENSTDKSEQLQAQIYLLQIEDYFIKNQKERITIDEKYQKLIDDYGINPNSISLQIAYANFLSFSFDNPEKGIEILESALPFAPNQFEKGKIKINLADILVYSNQFNQALILYSQVQSELVNSELAQTARFKVAQTSYFKGDFKWAQTQLKVLKSSTSQLISNDAIDLNLVIANNTANDSIQDALKQYAKADLLAYQNKNETAIKLLDSVLVNFKGHEIEDDALYKQAELYTKTNNYELAESNYLKIMEISPDGVLRDDACYALAELYNHQMNHPEKAKEMYQKIIFEFPSSIYLVDSRKKFRILRGDEIQ
jgi:tetratricopeptide (TPR) repeat protein